MNILHALRVGIIGSTHDLCLNCGDSINKPIKNAEEKLKSATVLETGKSIYYAILDHRLRSIDLCNWCYSIMKAYRYSLTKEERFNHEN